MDLIRPRTGEDTLHLTFEMRLYEVRRFIRDLAKLYRLVQKEDVKLISPRVARAGQSRGARLL